jgi:microcystin-dependent protein
VTVRKLQVGAAGTSEAHEEAQVNLNYIIALVVLIILIFLLIRLLS